MSQPIKVVDTSIGLVLFDGLQAVVWKILMKRNVTADSVRIKNIAPGQRYTFIFQQDAQGGYTFAWPPIVFNGGAIDRVPDSVSVQSYIGSTGGILIPQLPGAWGT